jgi:predicted Rossmann fold flavoprotein
VSKTDSRRKGRITSPVHNTPIDFRAPLAKYDVVIIGAGAAGLAAAIFTRRLSPERAVALLDGARKLGAKVLVSGGGRCNVTNASVTEHDFWGGRSTIVRNVLRRFTVAETVQFFEQIGVRLHEEAGGKLFPDSNRARDVLDALIGEAERVGVHTYTGHRVQEVVNQNGLYQLTTPHGLFTARRVVLATGGRSLPKSGSDGAGYEMARALGHTIVPATPALAPLVLDDREPLHKRLTGVSHDAELTVWVDDRQAIRLDGALLWTHFGISGPVVLNASRHWCRARLENRSVRVTLKFLPSLSFDHVEDRLASLMASRRRASMPTLLATLLPAAVAEALVSAVGIDENVSASQLTRADRRRLVHALVERDLPISDTRGYNYAEATAGGITLTEIDPSTMASRIAQGLYVVGEVLDVDGRIGGFNFQWAWSTAHVAAHALATP